MPYQRMGYCYCAQIYVGDFDKRLVGESLKIKLK